VAMRRRERRRIERLSFLRGASDRPAPAPDDARLLIPFLSDGRLARVREVLSQRTSGLVLVLDRLYDPHNLSAILRTADAFGLQHVWLTGSFPEGLNPQVALGAHRWLTLHHEPDAGRCAARLRESGYRIAAAVLSPEAVNPRECRPDGPVALVLGNEHEGLGPDWLGEADFLLRIPLRGFARSLNVSVAAGILLCEMAAKPGLREHGLPPEEAEALEALWIYQSLPEADRILEGIKSGEHAGALPKHDVER
jgi:tRNA (guanosine-2'-O-)-methyltransferase